MGLLCLARGSYWLIGPGKARAWPGLARLLKDLPTSLSVVSYNNYEANSV